MKNPDSRRPIVCSASLKGTCADSGVAGNVGHLGAIPGARLFLCRWWW